ncbi:MAG: anaerobic ribonucleoside-triphosphate reductase activating protein [Dethiobacteraceae bacterium]|jgi:anaerobic ribonucleoside-triphosphate reductase activating protein|nr:anaerobic ribonucleoside-triphosphate reductase activating protein [Bacillota bacterium]
MKLNLAGLHKYSVVDGPGIRSVVFTQGCPHHCPGCHNPHTHDPAAGEWVEISEVARQLLTDKNVRGITFSGGEPFLQARALAALAALLKAQLPGLHLTVYSGYTYEQLQQQARQDAGTAMLLAASDLLIDGPYLEGQRDLSLLYRGSQNQRIIDVPASIKSGKIVLSELHYRGVQARA